MTGAFRLGAAHGVVTPSAAGPLAGYAARAQQSATGTLDELEATVVVLDGAERVVLVCLDAVAVTSGLARLLTVAVDRAVGGEARVLVAASHTHSGPAAWLGDFAPGHRASLDGGAVVELVERVEAIATDAVARLAPVDLVWGEPEVTGLAAPRLAPSASIQVRVGALAALRDGAVVAILVDAPCHPTVLGPDSTAWSADWPGGLRRRLRERHEGAEIAYLNGASGDLSTRFTRRAATVAEAERLGVLVADAVCDSLLTARPLATDGPHARRARLALPARRLDPGVARARLAAARAAADAAPGDVVARSVADGAAVELAVAETNAADPLEVPVTILRLGDVTWVATPLEIFSSTAAAVRRDVGSVRLLGCVDDYLGYLPDAASFDAESYEARTSRFARDAEPVFRAQLVPALIRPTAPRNPENL